MAIIDFEKICPNCESENIEVINYSDDVDHKGFVLSVQGLQEHTCLSCDHDWKTQSDYDHNAEILKSAYTVERDKKRVSEGLLTAKEIEDIRLLFGINQREAAVLFGGGYNAFNKYESGEVLQSYAMDRLLRMTKAFGVEAINFLKNPYGDHKFTVNKFVAAQFLNPAKRINTVTGVHTWAAHGKEISVMFDRSAYMASHKAVRRGLR